MSGWRTQPGAGQAWRPKCTLPTSLGALTFRPDRPLKVSRAALKLPLSRQFKQSLYLLHANGVPLMVHSARAGLAGSNLQHGARRDAAQDAAGSSRVSDLGDFACVISIVTLEQFRYLKLLKWA